MKNFEDFLLEEGLDDGFQELNEDFQTQAANNQAKLQSVTQRIAKTKQKADDLTRRSQELSDRASKTKDDLAKNVYAAKIDSNNARRQAYMDFGVYLQSLQTYYQEKAKEITSRMKASQARKL